MFRVWIYSNHVTLMYAMVKERRLSYRNHSDYYVDYGDLILTCSHDAQAMTSAKQPPV